MYMLSMYIYVYIYTFQYKVDIRDPKEKKGHHLICFFPDLEPA